MYWDLLVSRLRHPAGEHGVEVLTVGGQHHPVGGKPLALYHQADVREQVRLLQQLQVAVSVLLPGEEVHGGTKTAMCDV